MRGLQDIQRGTIGLTNKDDYLTPSANTRVKKSIIISNLFHWERINMFTIPSVHPLIAKRMHAEFFHFVRFKLILSVTTKGFNQFTESGVILLMAPFID